MDELISLADASKRYGLTREGIYYHARKGNITIYRRAGDKKSYVKAEEMDKLTSFKPVIGKEAEAKTDPNSLAAPVAVAA